MANNGGKSNSEKKEDLVIEKEIGRLTMGFCRCSGGRGWGDRDWVVATLGVMAGGMAMAQKNRTRKKKGSAAQRL